MSHPLPPLLDTAAAGALRLDLRRVLAQGAPLCLDGSGVERAGLAGLQVLVAARRAAEAAGTGFRIDRPSAPLAEMARLAGLADLIDA